MSAANWLTALHLSRFSKPQGERPIYRAIERTRAASIVEIGVGSGRRTERMLRLALRHHRPEQIRYAGVDLFEGRPGEPAGISLKRAHQMLKRHGVQVRLAPGDPFSALARSANSLPATDLIVISADQDADSLSQAWFYMPRMLHEASVVFVEQPGRGEASGPFVRLCRFEIEQLAREAKKVDHQRGAGQAA